MIKHDTGKSIFTILIILYCGIIVNGQVIGVEESSQMEQVSSLMRGGNSLKKENFPWFAFIRIGFPEFQWKFWDEKDSKMKSKKFTWSNSYVNLCSGVWVTPKHVITADHCFWVVRPKYHSFGKGNPKKNKNLVEFFKNMIEDKSTYTDKNTKLKVKRGNLDNIAVKLYGNDYASAHPTDATTENDGIFTPWFQTSGRAFKVQRYHYIDGGANAEKTGSNNANNVDIAVLTLYKSLVTAYFNNLPLSLTTDVFDRLEWVKDKKKDKLTDKMETIVIGAGHRSKTDLNPEQKAFVSKEYKRKSNVKCKKHVPWYNIDWNVCMVNMMGANNDKVMHGDSGGPVFTEIKEKTAIPDDRKRYRLHAINGQKYLHKPVKGRAEYWSVTVYVGDKKKKKLGL